MVAVMGGKLKPYSDYKYSGVEWLGDVPADWDVERLKCALTDVVEQTLQLSHTGMVVALENVESWTGRVSLAHSGELFDSQLKRFRSGDVLFGKLRPYLAKVTRPVEGGLCVGEFLVLRPRRANINGTYIEHLLRSRPFIDEVTASTYGAKMPRTNWRSIGDLAVALPPAEEQAGIARFLDHTNRRIQRYILGKEKLVALLDEYRQTLVSDTVTGRIDVRTGKPYSDYKYSGVEWLGKVPAHWDVRRLASFGTFSKGSGGSKEEEFTFGAPCIRYGDLYTTHQYFITKSRSFVSPRLCVNYTPIRFGDLLFAASGETIEEIGKSAVNLITADACCGGDVILFRPRRIMEARYLGYATDCRPATIHKATMSRGFTVVHIYTGQLKNLRLALPPLSEQAAIARFLDSMTEKLRKGISQAQKKIELLREYHTRLIADVVTGKLDVRDAAAGLTKIDTSAAAG